MVVTEPISPNAVSVTHPRPSESQSLVVGPRKSHFLDSQDDLNAHFLRTSASKDFIFKVPSCKQHIVGWFFVCFVHPVLTAGHLSGSVCLSQSHVYSQTLVGF